MFAETEMLTDKEIQKLIKVSKIITEKDPIRGFKEEDGHKRCNLKLETTQGSESTFTVFVRQNCYFLENFSIGLRYQTKNKTLGTVTLIRYNGPHGELSQNEDGHYAKPHIHRITTEDMLSGNVQPQESRIEITDSYVTFEEALDVFFFDVGVQNYQEYFPRATQLGLSLQ